MREAIVFPETTWARLSALAEAENETAGIALASEVSEGSQRRLLVRSLHVPSPREYVARTSTEAVLDAGFVARIVAVARAERLSIIFFHTHPFQSVPAFSRIDDAGERSLRDFVDRRIPNRRHGAVVVGRHAATARILGTGQPLDVQVIGPRVYGWPDHTTRGTDPSESSIYDRQVRAFGRSAQAKLRSLRVGIVGLGGTGSIVAQQLAHLGVGEFLLIDPDVIETSNLNRVVGAEPEDASTSAKVQVAKRYLGRLRSDAQTTALTSDVTVQKTARRLIQCDVVFGCTDSHGSRYVLNQLAYQYFVPVIDIGVAIVANSERLSHVFGRVQMLTPGMPCLTCLRTLDPKQVRQEMLSAFERKTDPYIIGAPDPQPAVISINSTVSSLAVTMLLAAFADVPADARHQIYDGLRGMVRNVKNMPVPDCVTCSDAGAFGRGDDWPMPGRIE